MKTIIICKDGNEQIRFEHQESDLCALKWLLQNQSQSTYWAIKWEGYTVQVIDEDTNKSYFWQGKKPQGMLRTIKVIYSDGTEIITNMAANLSDKDMMDYFAPGKVFNLGSLYDNLQKVVSREILL